VRRGLERRHPRPPVTAAGAQSAGRQGARARLHGDVRLGAGVLPDQGDVRAGSRAALPGTHTLVEASNNDRIARDEVFGPVAAIIPFSDEADAVRIANHTPYGLSGSIWTTNGARALRVARALETGVLSINSNSSVRVSTPFGGFKQSGFGRELGMNALDGYSEVKNVLMTLEG
jgi:acyl-CoA reductase-like NAD-dependent aldehyde dehydrogenase